MTVEVTLANPMKPDLAPVTCKAMAHAGIAYLLIPAAMAAQLCLDEIDARELTLSNGVRQKFAYVGPVVVQQGQRRCIVGAVVMGSEVVLGFSVQAALEYVVRMT